MKNLFYLFAFILFFASCSENLVDVTSSENGNNDIEVREGSDGDFECMPGSYSEGEDLIQFENTTEFINTLNFFSCASAEEINVWRSTLSTYTSKKAYLDFKEEAALDKVNSFEQLQAIENQYQDKIKLIIDEEAFIRSHEIEFKYYNEIVNTEGLFMISTKYARVIGNRLLVVTNGSRNYILSLNQDTPSGSDGDIEISNTEIEPRHEHCCPTNKKVEKVYYDDGTKKLTAEYWFQSFYVSKNYLSGGGTGGGYYSIAQLEAKGRIKHEKIKKFLFWSYWGCDKTSLSYEANLAGEYTLGDFGSSTDVNTEGTFDITFSGTRSNSCEFESTEFIAVISNAAAQAPVSTVFTICLEEAVMEGVNTKNGISKSYVCGADEEALNTPKIIFYEDNNCEGSIVCTIELDPEVGYIDFTNFSPCDNDEARSAILVNMKQGMKLKVFDNSEMKLDDDYTIMTIKSDFAEKKVNTFELDTNDSQLNVNYFPKNGLDGKVSSFIDQ